MSKQSIYQTGTINSLLQAVYDGDTTIADLSKYGDFGLGALDAIDGELIACDGKFFRADATHNLNEITPQNRTPFAMVTKFKPDLIFELSATSFTELEQQLSSKLISQNLIYAIKITGSFARLELRSEECTNRPYRKLTEILPKLQRTFCHTNLNGTLVGVWFPKYLVHINVPGFHFHFIDANHKIGGHVFGLNLINGQAELQILHSLQLDLIKSDDFYQANLDSDHTSEVAEVEQIRSVK